jgi:tRNA 2-thiocytidine biosynthesis protein TtcA
VNFIAHVPSSKKEIKIQEKRLAKLVGKAVQDFRMINEGDRVLVGVSGGKDSLTLVNILRGLQARAPIKFELGCVTVDPQTPEYDPSKLKTYFASLGIPYFYESQPILASAAACMDPKRVSICSFCSRMKRGILYATLRREKYNVLALGQHLDDLAESFVMSAFHNGALRTMKVRVRGMTRGYVPGRLLQTHIH